MRKWVMMTLCFAVLALPVWAWQPSGWVYFNHPYVYDRSDASWHWFNTPDTQWVNGFTAGGWTTLDVSGMANGWSFFNWPYAYCSANGSWYYINEVDTQWVINLDSGSWSLFGMNPAPEGMVRVPAGTNAGTNPLAAGEVYNPGWYPETYNLDEPAFYMDAHEVTKGLWDEVYNWAAGQGYDFVNSGSGKDTNHPVHTVNWHDCVKWCNARSEKHMFDPTYYIDPSFSTVYRSGQESTIYVKDSADGFRLPTDSQWEYAARGGTMGRRFQWQDSDEIQHARANYISSATYSYDTSPTRGYNPAVTDGTFLYTAAVGRFAPNGFGLYDMTGNVWEWCFDLYPELQTGSRIYRGGGWNHHAFQNRLGYRNTALPGYTNFDIGFRTVRPVPEP